SANWDAEVELAGKRVAVIGTGASAIQFVPRIAPQVQRLSLFQRSAPSGGVPSRRRCGPAWRSRKAR
ncbi:hypothetical protein ACV34H_33825, partial [Pseudomonas aeruginosa]